MAQKRMFSQQIVDSDAFLEMPLSAQALYFHLSMRADDDGFVNNPVKISRIINASSDDLKLLLAKNFIIAFENGVIVIKHWRINNYLRADRYHKTAYQDELAMLEVKENGAYTLADDAKPLLGIPDDNQMATNGIRSIDLDLDKNRLREEKISIKASKDAMSVETDAPNGKTTKIDYESICEYWNTHSLLKEITKITDQRKPNVGARIKEHGLESIYKMIDQAGQSPFLRGDNKQGFIATFDWCFKPKNFVKVLEGNYIDEKKSYADEINARAERLEKRIRGEIV
jgi:hypothetical protein